MFESITAAIYLDSGSLEEAKRFVLHYIEPAAQSAGERPFKDHKTMLQEIIQQNPGERLEYVLTGEHGPDHDKHFTVEVHLNSNVIGKGGGRKEGAEMQASTRSTGADAGWRARITSLYSAQRLPAGNAAFCNQNRITENHQPQPEEGGAAAKRAKQMGEQQNAASASGGSFATAIIDL